MNDSWYFILFYVKITATVQKKWIPEIEHFCPGVPFIIVGHETKLEDNIKHLFKPITCSQGRRLAEKVGAVAYMECCAKTGEGVNEVFSAAALASLKMKRQTAKPGKKWLLFCYNAHTCVALATYVFPFGCSMTQSSLLLPSLGIGIDMRLFQSTVNLPL